MKLETIKLELIEWLTKLEDQDTIEYLKVVKDAKLGETDWGHELTAEQTQALARGLKDIDQGRVTAHEEVKKRFEI